VIDCLLAAGALFDSRNAEGRTAMNAASQEGKLEAVRSLIRGGAVVNLTCICSNGVSTTALMLASQLNHSSVVEALLEVMALEGLTA
jgi:ankyrin repeat protein